MQMIRTVLIDDHPLFCDGIERLLADSGHFVIIGKYQRSADFLRQMTELAPDLLLIDIEMEGMDGLETIRRIRLNNHELKIAVLSMHYESVYTKEAYSSGANEYLIKSIGIDALIDALLAVIQNKKTLVNNTQNLKSASPLSPQETKIVKLIADGSSSKDIASNLNLSVFTIQTHRRNINKKLHVNNTAELIKIASATGLI